ncbi:hypothetical protein SAMN05444156_2623 [Verrucomicrobium sp. GAS474]|uniref:sensor histidine kinase n=1 Tax=Verrucomicrobium sp. GAS474 TaxID=1882831 RepID=UPI00087C72FE|nr:PAS domain-containing sensor histidine kinase [Verrucomicrobium sp. GAS474]SDU21028.1 hypothetical protein SAMN05444156_2623 [Verrucomicrobium sp. GAS474]
MPSPSLPPSSAVGTGTVLREDRPEDQLIAVLGELRDIQAALDEHSIVAITDATGKITRVNDRFCALSKYSREELIGQDHRIINSGHHPKSFFTDLWKTIARGHIWHGEVLNRAKDGSLYWVDTTIFPRLNAEGKPTQYVAIRTDITQRKANEGQLISVLGELRDIQAALDEHSIVAVTDATGKITKVNDQFCALSKYSREELIGQDHRIINSGHHPKSFFTDLWKTIARGKVWRGEVLNRAKDGSLYWVDTTVFPRMNEAGKPTQYVAIRTDITERKANEKKLIQVAQDLTDRNKELEMIVYTISHDLRSPLVNIQGFGKQLERSCDTIRQSIYAARDGQIPAEVVQRSAESVIPQALHFINASANKIDILLSGILRYSRLGRATIQVEPLDMNVMVAEIVAAMKFQVDEMGARIDLITLPPCLGDRPHTGQVIANLIDNALKYRSPDRPMRIVVGGKREEEEGRVLYWISDNGIGIAPEHQAKVFEIFHRLNPESVGGEGLGLTIAQRMLERQDGKIWVESAVAQGTTFYISLPAVPVEKPEPSVA